MTQIFRLTTMSCLFVACFIQTATAQSFLPTALAGALIHDTSSDAGDEAKTVAAKTVDAKKDDAKEAKTDEVHAAQPLVSLMLTDANALYSDMKFLLGEGKDEEKAYDLFESTLDVFLIGCDRTKPFGAAIYLENSELQMTLFVPVNDPAAFFDNIADLDIISEPESGGFYKITGGIFQGSARLVDGYVYFAESKDLLLRELPDPQSQFRESLDKNYDVAVRIQGESATPEQRREAFGKFRKETTAALKPMKEEAENDFEIRKTFLEFQFDEIERFFAESKQIRIGWKTDREEKKGKLHIELEAIPDTPLAKTIEVLKQTDGKANEAMPEDFVSYASSQFLFGEMRQKHMLALSKLLRKKAMAKVDAEPAIKAEDKASASKVANLLFDLMDANTQEGTLIGWLKSIKDKEGKQTIVGQTTITDVGEVKTTLEESGVAEMNVDTVADKADIHKLPLYGDYAGLKGQFGDELAIYFATGTGDLKNRAWAGMGVNAVDQIKKAIEANEEAGPVAAQFRVRVGSWVDALVDESKKKPEAEEPKPKRRGRGRPRKKKKPTDVARIAWDTLGSAEDDVLTFSLEKIGPNSVVINETLDTGLLRFIGTVMAKEINANLQ